MNKERQFDYAKVSLSIAENYSEQVITVHYIAKTRIVRLHPELVSVKIEEVIFNDMDIMPILSEAQIYHLINEAKEHYKKVENNLRDVSTANNYIDIEEEILWSQ